MLTKTMIMITLIAFIWWHYVLANSNRIFKKYLAVHLNIIENLQDIGTFYIFIIYFWTKSFYNINKYYKHL